MSEIKPPLTLKQQAEMIDAIVGRCVTLGGDVAGEAMLVLDRETVGHLHHLALRLERMGPHQKNIETLVRYGADAFKQGYK